jgi:hypothetical protein
VGELAEVYHLSEDAAISEFVPYVAATAADPPEPVGDVLELHRAAGIELRVLDDLWPWWDVVSTTTLGHGAIGLPNAAPRR